MATEVRHPRPTFLSRCHPLRSLSENVKKRGQRKKSHKGLCFEFRGRSRRQSFRLKVIVEAVFWPQCVLYRQFVLDGIRL